MRQVNRDELIHMVQDAMRTITPAMWQMMQHHDAEQKLKARTVVAGRIADKMARLEILSSAPPPPHFHYPALHGPRKPHIDADGTEPQAAGVPERDDQQKEH